MTERTQAQVWNGPAGAAWVRHRGQFDATLTPFGEAVMERLPLDPGAQVLDVGCGTGHTAVEIARRVDPGQVVGVDISLTMLAAARARAAEAGVGNVAFEEADVQTSPLGEATFDVAFSRLGVMFFSDPVAAFTAVRRSLVAGGRLGFICFQEPSRNPLVTLPVMAAMAPLGLTPPPAGAPSPFALAAPERIRSILGDAGFTDISIDHGPDIGVVPVDGSIDDTARRVLEQNPATASALERADEAAASAALAATAAALEEHRQGAEVRLGAATWVVLATAPSAS